MTHVNKSYELEQQILTFVQSISDIPQMLSEIASFLGKSFQADLCILRVDTQPKSVIWSSQWSSETLERLKENLMGETGIERLIDSQEPQIISFKQVYLTELGITNGLGISIFFRAEQNGWVILIKENVRKWTKYEKNQLKKISKTLGIAYHLAQEIKPPTASDLDGETEERFTQLTRMFPNQGSPIVKQLYELMRQQLTQQRQLNEFKDNIITAISDKARNPLASMRMAITMLKQENLPSDLKQRYVGILEDEWQQLNVLINNIVTLKQLETHELTVTPQPLSILPLIEQTAYPLAEKWQQDHRKGIHFEIIPLSCPKTFYTDPKHLRNILEELLTNAGNYANDHSTVKLTIEQVNHSDWEHLMIQIENQGCKINADEKEQIFELFYRGKDAIAHSIPGTGIGLTLVKGLVHLLQGEIALVNRANQEGFLTTVTLTFPSLKPDVMG